MTEKTLIWARFAVDGRSVEFEPSSPIEESVSTTLNIDGEPICFGKTEKRGETDVANFGDFPIDPCSEYRLGVEGFEGDVRIVKASLIDTAAFVEQFELEACKLEYGALYEKTGTLFRLWAPFARSVELRLYAAGSGGERIGSVKMKKRTDPKWGGVWEIYKEGDLAGVYYTYAVDNGGGKTETADPYAKACGINGFRGMVVDLRSTDPEGWERDGHIGDLDGRAADTPIVWEIHVGDFSASPDSGMKYKGKYLAFTETGTHVPGSPHLPTGVDYLKALGVSYVQLNPVFDFATVDEAEMSGADDTKDRFNWGYDPQNYNIPEGSYSTDPARGQVRINEFKRMVKALHDAGIGVIMDVVYNHTYSVAGQPLHDCVPYYYHRTDGNGRLTNGSGCGNETASERTMCRKYIVDSALYWASEYHIDGFRFDLMGIHDLKTIEAVRKALDALPGGEKILMYGEPWASYGFYQAPSFERRAAATGKKFPTDCEKADNTDNMTLAGEGYAERIVMLPETVAVFNDSGRDGLRGNVRDGYPGKGWVNGELFGVYKVKKMIEGGASGFGDGLFTGTGSRNIAYASAHDNYTLWDQLLGKRSGTEAPSFYDMPDRDRIAKAKLVEAALMLSGGIPFMLAGDEMGRTKYGNENSYSSPAKLNRIEWSRQEDFHELLEHCRTLIHLRRKYGAELFSYSASRERDYCLFDSYDGDDPAGRIAFKRTRGGITLEATLDAKTGKGRIAVGDDVLEW